MDADAAYALSLSEWTDFMDSVESFNIPVTRNTTRDYVPLILTNITLLFPKVDYYRILEHWLESESKDTRQIVG